MALVYAIAGSAYALVMAAAQLLADGLDILPFRFLFLFTWKTVLSRLVHESDAVLMDLRGFSRDNAGCVFELHELARLVPLDRVVFITDRRTDEALLAETLGAGRAGVFRFTAMHGGQLRQLMRALAAAATPLSQAGV